jgi:hypothetical protein
MLAAVAGAAVVASRTATALPDEDDSELLRLEEEIFEASHAANAHNEEIDLLDDARRKLYELLLEHETARGQFLSYEERWQAVSATPDGRQFETLVAESNRHFARMAELIDTMWKIPARTEKGRAAKTWVVLSCVLDWLDRDDQVGWRVLKARHLLADLVGGESGRNMRDQWRA